MPGPETKLEIFSEKDLEVKRLFVAVHKLWEEVGRLRGCCEDEGGRVALSPDLARQHLGGRADGQSEVLRREP